MDATRLWSACDRGLRGTTWLGDAEGREVEGEVVAADGEKVEVGGDGGTKTAAPVPVTVPAAPTAAEARV